METKLENYEKEIKQLQKALEKSDNYILELESSYKKKPLLSPVTPVSTTNSIQSYQKSQDDLKFIKGDNLTFKNELKIVKFVDNLADSNANKANNGDLFTSSSAGMGPTSIGSTPTTTNSSSSSSSTSTGSKLGGIISNDKFYGTPKKTIRPASANTHSMLASSTSSSNKSQYQPIDSFNDRFKKNLSFDLEVPSPLTQSLNCTTNSAGGALKSDGGNMNLLNSNGFNSASYNDILNESTVAAATSITNNYNSASLNSNQHDFLFSPMKRIRMDDYHQLEKPNFSTLLDDTTTMASATTGGGAGGNSSSGTGGSSSGATTMESEEKEQKTERSNYPHSNNLNVSLTPEFNDCLQLLNEAESKIQSRSSPYMSKYTTNTGSKISPSNSNASNGLYSSSLIKANTSNANSVLPDKYMRSTSSSTSTSSHNTAELTQYKYQSRTTPYGANDKIISSIAQNNTLNPTSKRSNSYDFKQIINNNEQYKNTASSTTPAAANNSSSIYNKQRTSPLPYDYHNGINTNTLYSTTTSYRSRSVEPNLKN